VLRQEIAQGTELGKKAKGLVARGGASDRQDRFEVSRKLIRSSLGLEQSSYRTS
jgi:adenylate kinase family enzyme